MSYEVATAPSSAGDLSPLISLLVFHRPGRCRSPYHEVRGYVTGNDTYRNGSAGGFKGLHVSGSKSPPHTGKQSQSSRQNFGRIT